MKEKGREATLKLGLLLPSFIFFSFFFLYPLSMGLLAGVYDGGWTAEYLATILGDSYYRHIILFTVAQAALSTVVTVLLGLPGAYILSHYMFRGKGIIRAITTIPFIMPSLMVVAGFIILFGSQGIITSLISSITGTDVRLHILYSWKAIILAHAFYNFPIVMRMVGPAWEKVDQNLEDAAKTLGAGPFSVFRRITLPLLAPSILAASILTFTFCFMSFAVVLMLGGVQYTTIEVSIYTLSNVMIKPHLASAMAIIQVSVSLVFMRSYLKISEKSQEKHGTRGMKALKRRDIFSPKGAAILAYSLLTGIIILGPMLAVIYSSLTYRTTPGLRWYGEIFSSAATPLLGISPVGAIFNSLYFAVLTVAITVPMALSLSYAMYYAKEGGRSKTAWLDPFFMLPMGVSSITLGLGMIRVFIIPPFDIYGSWFLIVIAHVIISFPFVFRAVSNSVRSLDHTLSDAARTLGAGRLETLFMVEMPQITPGIIVGAIFAFAISLGEFGATLMLYRPEYSTIPIAIYRFLEARNLGAATAMSVLLMLFAGISFLTIERFSGEKTF